MQRFRAGVLTGFTLTLWAGGVAAQTTPGSVGQVQKKPPAVQQPAPPAKIERSSPAAASAKGGKAVPVRKFDFYGNTLISSAELGGIVASFTGRPLTLFDIYEAADKVTAFYVAKGYSLATVNVPAQKVDSGVVRLEVIEGVVGRIAVEGARWYRPESMKDYLPGVREGTVYRGSTLATGLNVLNELPGLTTKAILRPGDVYGTTDVVVQATERHFEGSATVDNYGRENIGRFRYSVAGTLNNPLRVEDQLQALFMISEDHLLRYGYVSYSVPVDFTGTRLAFSYGDAQFDIDSDLPLEIDGSHEVGRVELSRPLVRSRTDRLVATFGISNTAADSTIEGFPISDTHIYLFELGGSWVHSYGDGIMSQVSGTMSSNFDRATYADLHSGPGGENHYADQRFRVELDTLHMLPFGFEDEWQALLRLAGSWSPDPLSDTQQYSIGGPNSVRGYPASETRGDRGYLASATFRRPFVLGSANLAGRVFVDSGWVQRIDVPDGAAGFRPHHKEHDSLTSVGVGGDARWKGLVAQLDLAWPRDTRDSHPVSDGHDHFRVFGSLSYGF